MKIDKFISCTSRLTREGELSDKDKEGMFQKARDFLAAGGTVSLDEWAGLEDSSREALVAAGLFISGARAQEIAMAIFRVQAQPPKELVLAGAANGLRS